MTAEHPEHLKLYEPYIIPVWLVTQGDEERKTGEFKWCFTTLEAAKEAAKGKGWFGGDATISQQTAIRIGDFAHILAQHLPKPFLSIYRQHKNRK